MSLCPFHADANLSSCVYCKRRAQYNAKHRDYVSKQRAKRRANPVNRPPPTDNVYRIDHPEKSAAEDVVAIMKTIVKEFRR